MLARLRHHAFISRDDQREQVDTVRSSQHVFDETFVTGNVDEADAQIVQLEIGKAEIDSDAATFFFRKTIGIDAGQSAYESALAVIDVTGGADNQRNHSHRLHGLLCDDLFVEIDVLRNHDVGAVTTDRGFSGATTRLAAQFLVGE